jgi:hypothetical protein
MVGSRVVSEITSVVPGSQSRNYKQFFARLFTSVAERSKRKWEDNIKVNIKELRCDG